MERRWMVGRKDTRIGGKPNRWMDGLKYKFVEGWHAGLTGKR